MGNTATIIAVSYTVVCVIAIAFMLLVVRSTRGRGPDVAVDLPKLRESEKKWFVAVVVMLAALLFATIFFTPYGKTASANAQIVNVTAVQFAWIISPATITAGRQVEFRLTSKDVNHSFAVYTDSGELLFQIQVVPGTMTDYIYTFRTPGTYQVACLEYCGVGHTLMHGQLTVTA